MVRFFWDTVYTFLFLKDTVEILSIPPSIFLDTNKLGLVDSEQPTCDIGTKNCSKPLQSLERVETTLCHGLY